MFKFLKEKLAGWTKKISKESQKVEKFEEKENTIHKEVDKKPEEKKTKKGIIERFRENISKVEISEQKFEEYSEDLQMLLLENNVSLEVSDRVIKELREKIVGKQIDKKDVELSIKNMLREIIEQILVESFNLEKEIIKKKEKPFVILFCGINGTGKTTSIAKVANLLKKEEITVIIAAADTFRAASIEQIKKHGENLGIKVISHNYGSDPASVGFDAIKYAQKNKIDCVLIDTAGRMYTEKNLMNEIEKISRVCKPDLKIFVGESITGNDATDQVKAFDKAIGIDGIILSKSDIDEKGGTALSVGYITKKPIVYLGTGQGYANLEKFDKNQFIKRLGL